MNDDAADFVEAMTHAVNGSSPRHGLQPATADAPNAPDWAKTLASAACWAQAGNSYFPVNSVVDKIPPGAYRCAMSNTGPYLDRMNINIDHLLALPDSNVEKLLNEFNQFWKLRESFDQRGFTFKRGMLMWGPPGSGKTSGVWQMTQRLIKDYKGVVVFVENPHVAVMCLNVLQRIEPERPIVTVMEDIDSIIGQYGDHQLLALLDGEFQINNVVHVATTNYPHLLDRRFVDRPSRFDTIMKVGMPTAEARRIYFQTKEPDLDKETLERWVVNSNDYSIAHLREVCIAVQCFKQSEDAVFERINVMRQIDNFDNLDQDGELKQQAGFMSNQAVRMKRAMR